MARLWRATILIGLVALGAGLVRIADRSTAPAAAAARAPKVTFGRSVVVGKGTARSYVVRDTRGHPTQIAIEFTAAALTGLPDREMEYVLPLPAGVSVAPYDHLSIDWMPHGHIPQHVYDVPHFDFHFYMVTPAELARITATGKDLAVATRTPAPGYLPDGYVTAPGAAFPHMGNHWISQASPEFHGKPFTYTFVYGSYNGRINFLEPMVTLAFLQTKPNVTGPVPQPRKYQKQGYYPMRYGIQYAARGTRYRISLDQLSFRKAGTAY